MCMGARTHLSRSGEVGEEAAAIESKCLALSCHNIVTVKLCCLPRWQRFFTSSYRHQCWNWKHSVFVANQHPLLCCPHQLPLCVFFCLKSSTEVNGSAEESSLSSLFCLKHKNLRNPWTLKASLFLPLRLFLLWLVWTTHFWFNVLLLSLSGGERWWWQVAQTC